MKSRLYKTELFFVLFLSLLAINITVQGQTNPEPYNLSTGSFSFTAWDSASTAGSFPPNMIFHFVSSNQVAPFYTDGTSDYDCGYNHTKRPRINGLLEDGISIVTTSSSQYNNCDSGAAASRYMGAVLLSLNASGRGNIRVQWTGETIIPGDGSPTPRIWNLRLQYRIGTSGTFTDVPGPVEYIASASAGSPLTFGPSLLPSECWNQPVVQLRWIYFESSAGSGGSRPKLRLDDITVNSDIYLGIDDTRFYADCLFNIYPNPAEDKFTITSNSTLQGTVKVLDILGKEVLKQAFSANGVRINCSSLLRGIYFIQLLDDENGKAETHKLILR